MTDKKIRVLVIDDDRFMRKLLADGLGNGGGIEVVGAAGDAWEARDKILELDPQALTLDIQMPKMDGVEFLKRLMPRYPVPVVMVSSLTTKGARTTLDALEAGAIDFVTKPGPDNGSTVEDMIADLSSKIKASVEAKVPVRKKRNIIPLSELDACPRTLAQMTEKVIAIAASTGGTEAIIDVVTPLPETTPCILVVQHMPPGFTKPFSERLNKHARMKVKEAEEGDRVENGMVYIAPAGRQLKVKKGVRGYRLSIADDRPAGGHCPSADVLMESVARVVGDDAVGMVLTGMGGDGARGLKAMRQAGARTLAQDKESCVVYGMPMEAWECGAAEEQVPLAQIPQRIIDLLCEGKPRPRPATAKTSRQAL